MGSHPINLFVRFILELIALWAFGYWMYKTQTGWSRNILMILLPVIIAVCWGVFAVPNDPSRSGNTVIVTSGIIRFIFEIVVFGGAFYALYKSGLNKPSFYFITIVTIHYVLSYDRILWLLKIGCELLYGLYCSL